MRYNQLGESDLLVSELCLGTMTYGQQNTLEQAFEQLSYAFEQGINFFDTAEMYPVPVHPDTQGRSEEILGHWLRHQKRDQVIVATKIVAPGRGLGWIRDGDHCLTPQNIAKAVEGSLRRLETSYIDLYQIHWPERYVPTFGEITYDPHKERDHIPIQEQLMGLDQQVKAGKIRYIGLSNETPWGVFSFCRTASLLGLPKAVSVQNAYNLLNRTFDYDLREVCHREHVSLLAYSPLAFGLLTGKYLQNQPSNTRLSLFAGFGGRYQKQNVDEAIRSYIHIAQDEGISLSHLALAVVRSQGSVTSTIVGATRKEQLVDNLSSLKIKLESNVLDRIQDVHKRFPNPAP